MPDVREVFEMATRAVEQDAGASERQFERQRRAIRNRRAGAIAISAILVVIVAAAIGVVRRPADPSVIEPPPPSPSPAANPDRLVGPWVGLVDLRSRLATPLPDQPFRAIPEAAAYEISPDGAMVAFQGSGREVSDDVIYVANIDGSDVRAITESPPEGADPAWSPDGKAIVFVGIDEAEYPNLFVVDVATGASTRLFRSPNVVSHPSFSPDGRSVLFTMVTQLPKAWRTDLWTVPVNGGRPTRLIEHAAYGTYSPDGATIAYRRTDPQPDAFCGKCWFTDPDVTFVAADGSEQPGPSEGGFIAPPGLLAWSAVRWSPDGSKVVYGYPWPDGVGRAGGQLHVVDLATGADHLIGRGLDPSWVDANTLLVVSFRTLLPP